MANAIYPTYKAACMSGGPNVNLVTGSIKLVAIHVPSYTFSATDQFLSDIPSGAQIAISAALSGNTVTPGGAFQTSNGRFTGVAGLEIEALVMFVDTGAPTTSRLVGYFDTGITGLPVTPGGASYNVIPDSSGWFVM